MFNEIVKQRMNLAGVTQAKLAEYVGATPSQMGLFLKGSASLNNTSLDKCFKALDINVDIYTQRYNKAVLVASILGKENIDVDIIAEMSKEKMIKITQMHELRYLMDINSHKELNEMIESKIVDIESTYPFFKAMVMHLLQIENKFTPKNIEKSYEKISSITAIAPLLGAFAAPISIIASLTFLAYNKYMKELGFLAPIFGLTEKLIKK